MTLLSLVAAELVQLVERAAECPVSIGGGDVDPFEERLVEPSPDCRRGSQVGPVGVLSQFHGEGDGGLDEPELGAGGVDGVLDLHHLPGDAVLLGLWHVEGHGAGEMRSHEGDAFLLEALSPHGRGLQLGP